MFSKKILVLIYKTIDAEGKHITNIIIGTIEQDKADQIFL